MTADQRDPVPDLAFELLAAANYIDALGGVSKSYRAAIAAHETEQIQAPAEGARPTVEEQRELLKRLRHYGDNDRDAACALIERLGADLYAAEGRANSLAQKLAEAQGCISGWVEFGGNVTDALGLRVMYPKQILAEIARLRAATESNPQPKGTAAGCPHRFMHFGDQERRRCADCGEVEATQAPAPAHEPTETVQVVGVKNGVETVLGTATLTPKMKARDLVREMFGAWEPDDGSDADMAFAVCEQLIEWMPQHPPVFNVQAPAVGPEIPESIQKIIENLHTQDNRITANPLFAVQQKRVIGGLESGYEDGWAWVDSDGEIHDEELISELNARFENGESEPDGCRRVGYIEKWEFVTGCLTEEGCKQYLRLDGHNLHEPRIYAYGGYRNVELEALRKWLMSLRGMTHLGEAEPPVQPTGERP